MATGNRKVTIQLVDDGAGAGAGGPQLFKGQDYEAIRTACLDSGILFRDPCFPAGASQSLGKHWVSPLQQVFTWRAEPAETKHPSLAPGTGNCKSLGLGGT